MTTAFAVMPHGTVAQPSLSRSKICIWLPKWIRQPQVQYRNRRRNCWSDSGVSRISSHGSCESVWRAASVTLIPVLHRHQFKTGCTILVLQTIQDGTRALIRLNSSQLPGSSNPTRRRWRCRLGNCYREDCFPSINRVTLHSPFTKPSPSRQDAHSDCYYELKMGCC